MNNNLKILIIDDEAVALQNLMHVLKKEGYSILGTQSSPEAMELLEKEPFDLVLTDLALPKTSGLEVIKAVKKKGMCPVVAMSAHWRDSPLLETAEELGSDALLAKPFDAKQLESLVASQLAARHS